VSGGYREGLYLYRQETAEEQMSYIRNNARGSADVLPYYDALIHWLTFNSKAENSNLSMIDVTIAVKQAYGMSID
jgi:hypothetical protein